MAETVLVVGAGLVSSELVPTLPDMLVLVPALILPLLYHAWALVVFLRAPLVSGVLRSFVISMLGIFASGVLITFIAGIIRGLTS